MYKPKCKRVLKHFRAFVFVDEIKIKHLDRLANPLFFYLQQKDFETFFTNA